MNKKWIIPSAALFFLGIMFARTENAQTGSPQQTLERFWAMETQGFRLTPERWYKSAEFFSGRPSPPPEARTIAVVSRCSIGTTSVNQKSADLYVFCIVFKTLNSNLLLEDPPHNAPSGGPVLTGVSIPFKLVLTDRRWEFGPGLEPEENKGETVWRIEGFVARDFLDKSAAINYVTTQRDKSSDPVLRQNAEKTIAILNTMK